MQNQNVDIHDNQTLQVQAWTNATKEANRVKMEESDWETGATQNLLFI